MPNAKAVPTLGEKRERWIGSQRYTTEEQAEAARLAYNQGAIDALHHQGELQLQHRPRPARIIAGLVTRPVELETRGAA